MNLSFCGNIISFFAPDFFFDLLIIKNKKTKRRRELRKE